MLSNHSYNNGNDSNNNNNASSNLNDNRGAIVGNAVSAAAATVTAPATLEGSSTALPTVEDSAAALGLDLQQQHHLSPDPYNSLMAAAAAAAAAVRKSVKQEFLAGGDLVGDGTSSAVGN